MEYVMPNFGKRSKERLSTCAEELQEIMNEAITKMDFSILCGTRSKEDQNKAFNEGKSKLKYPQSKHNSNPSRAIDIAPYPIDWNDLERFEELAKIVKEVASSKDIAITWGGDWQSFKDMPHYELQDVQEYLDSEPTDEDINVSLEEIENQIFNS